MGHDMLSLQHLTVAFGTKVVLRDVCLDAGPGDAVCLLGEEGSGKTTLLKLLTREISPQEGVIKVDGAVLAQLPREVLRMYRLNVGYLAEDATLDDARDIASNVGMALDLAGMPVPERDRAVADLLKRLRLTGVSAAKPHAVSRGERQLAAFARAIATGPAIILLDEPFQGIGDETAAICATMLKNMRKKGATVIVATAEERTANLFDDALVARMSRGKLTEASAPAATPERTSTRIQAEDAARAATTGLVERETAVAAEPAPSETPKTKAEGKKIRITSVSSL